MTSSTNTSENTKEPKEKPLRKLTHKQKGFIKDYIVTGNGVQSALKNYDTTSPEVANAIAVENLQKPSVKGAILEALGEDLLAEKHLALLNSTKVEHMVFPLGPEDRTKKLDTSELPAPVKTMLDAEQALQRTDLSDEEIREMLAEVNCKVKRIVHGETSRHVYYWAADNKAVKDALDMAYKIRGTYAPEKSVNLNLEVSDSPEIKKLTDQLNAVYRGTGLSSDGGASSPVGHQVQD